MKMNKFERQGEHFHCIMVKRQKDNGHCVK